MSFILDALRKSEAQRRRGEAPTITESGDLAADAVPGSASRFPKLFIFILFVLVILFLWWLLFPSGLISEKASNQEQAEVAQGGETLAGSAEAAGKKGTAGNSQPSTPVAKQIQAPRTRNPVESYRAPELSPLPQQRVTIQAPPSADSRRIIQHTQPEPSEEPAEPTPAAAAESTAGSDISRETSPIGFYELPGNIRQELGEMVISMQVWSKDPQARFAIVSGRRVKEGDNIDPGALVVEILRKGVILSYRNYLFVVGN